MDETGIGGGNRSFPTTRWSIILEAKEDLEAREVALSELVARYWKPLYYYTRRKGADRETAKDNIQGFLAHLLERDFIERLDPSKGRLRGYLKVALDRFLADQYDKASTLKRGGAFEKVHLDFEVAENELTSTPPNPEDAYHYGWAVSLMDRAFQRLREEFASGERTGPFELVQAFFGVGEAPSYEEAAEKYDMSVPKLKSFLHRARARFKKILAEEVAETVAASSETDQELSELLALLNG